MTVHCRYLVWLVINLLCVPPCFCAYFFQSEFGVALPGYVPNFQLSLDYPIETQGSVYNQLPVRFQVSPCLTNLGFGFHHRQLINTKNLHQWGGYLSQQTQYHHDLSRLYTAINTGLEALNQRAYVSLFHTLGVKWGSQRPNMLIFPGTDIQFRESIQKPYHALGGVLGYQSFLFGSRYRAQFNLSTRWWYHSDLYPKRIQTQALSTTITKRPNSSSQRVYPISIEFRVERGVLSHGFVYHLGLKYQPNFVSTDTPKGYSQIWPLDLSSHVLLGSDIKPHEASVFLNKIMNIVVINLDKHTDRLATITQFIQQMGLNLDRFPAVNGRERYPEPLDIIRTGQIDVNPNAPWSKWRVKDSFYNKLFRRYGGYGKASTHPVNQKAIQSLSGHVGCSMSHIGALTRYLNSEKPFLWVLEDDAVASISAPQLAVKLYLMFQSYALKPKDVDIILLHDRPDCLTCGPDNLGTITGQSSPGSHAYLVPTAKISKIIEKGGPPFKGGWDKWWSWSFMNIKRYGTYDIMYPRGLSSSKTQKTSSTSNAKP